MKKKLVEFRADGETLEKATLELSASLDPQEHDYIIKELDSIEGLRFSFIDSNGIHAKIIGEYAFVFNAVRMLISEGWSFSEKLSEVEEIKDYGDWQNYETCTIFEWFLSNENKDDLQIKAEQYKDQYKKNPERAIIELSKVMCENILNKIPKELGLYSNLLSHAVKKVDWYNIAKKFIESLSK